MPVKAPGNGNGNGGNGKQENGEEYPTREEHEAQVALIEEEIPSPTVQIMEYRIEYRAAVVENYQKSEYSEGITVVIEGGTREARLEKYNSIKRGLMSRVLKTAYFGLNHILGGTTGEEAKSDTQGEGNPQQGAAKPVRRTAPARG